ncbi:GLPGLI family protein [Porphyromonas pogonae]|uniref:GLPGLI family protein n=1 Tax=Porphyromonas pogonae TaxID=867595 RepID=UPI002E75BF72|nr:GLPGLI family protein [Porphyromonas pogonae]
MKDIFKTLILSLLSINSLQAQAPINLRIHYETKYQDVYIEDKICKYKADEMILDITPTSSEFYSLWKRSYDASDKKIFDKGGTLADAIKAREQLPYPKSQNSEIFYKGLPQKGMITVIEESLANIKYSDKEVKIQWDIIPTDTLTIAGYHCNKAIGSTSGRKWIAWYAPDIPVPNGPRMLGGLPGLILKAYDSQEHYIYVCSGIETEFSQKENVQLLKKPLKTISHKEYNKIRKLFWEDTKTYMQLLGQYYDQGVGADGRPLKQIKRKSNFIELMP